VLIPLVLALGTNTPVYSALWHALPPFRFPRVPERLLPIACLCLAALLAFATARTRLAAVVIVLVLVDLHVHVYRESAAGRPEQVAYRGGGRVLELPVFDPSVHYGSVYLWYDTASQRERPGGYATTAPKSAKRTADRLQRLNCGDWSDGAAQELDRLGVRAIALHLGLYDRVGGGDWFALQSLLDQGWAVQRVAGSVLLFERRPARILPVLPAPSPTTPVFCQGWYGDTGDGRYMSETHAPFWIHGSGRIRLRFAPSQLQPRVTVHRGEAGWRLVTVDVPRLVRVENQTRRVGAKLLEITSP
jgi:hypothetical protein